MNVAGLEKAVRAALRSVIDPELGHNLVDLGMIYEVAVTPAGAARIVMTTTTPGCPAAALLSEGVSACAAGVDGITDVEVELSFSPPWTPERISPELRHLLGFAAVN